MIETDQICSDLLQQIADEIDRFDLEVKLEISILSYWWRAPTGVDLIINLSKMIIIIKTYWRCKDTSNVNVDIVEISIYDPDATNKAINQVLEGISKVERTNEYSRSG